MKLKYICFMIIFSLFIFSTLGCISEWGPGTSNDIYLNSDHVKQDFYVISDNELIWTLNSILINTTYSKNSDNDTISVVNIHYSDFPSGVYKLKVIEDSDISDSREWTIVISNDQYENINVKQSINNDQSKSWNDIWSKWEQRFNEQMNKKR